MSKRDELLELCVGGMKKKGFLNQIYQDRLKVEIKQVDDAEEHAYFIDLFHKKLKFPKNENNLLIVYLLDLVEDFNIEEPPIYFYGEFPDCDVDYIAEVQQYLKKEWAPKQFGARNVCPIGNYGTFGIKMSLTDMAKIFGKDHHEIKAITTSIEEKDDEGKPIKWEKALELYPALKAYCEVNPEVADAAKRLLNRNRSLGKHAGGLIISKSPVDHLIPLIRNAEDAEPVSAFVEGLHGTDLGPLGFIKFDLLVVNDLQRTSDITALVKKRHNLSSYYALPGQGDWSDDSYINDPDSLKMANDGDLKGIFQFDSDGIRRMVKAGGVTSFDDIPAYSALYRPSALSVGGDKTYIERKREGEYTLHPLLEPILDKTYGVMLYQEQVMKILNLIGDIPLTHCEKARKAISKKVEANILVYKEAMIKNGQIKLQYSEKEINEMWGQILSWSGYGFNKSHSYSYAHTSARLLNLKAHFPIEFFAGTLANESESDKIKEYKTEAERHKVKINRVDINKSGWNFQIVDDTIYMGFSNVKGIGEEVAKKIVANQPYSSFEDFLKRFGTAAGVLKPLIGLGLFDEFCKDRSKLWEFALFYKDGGKKRADRDKRAELSRQKIRDEFTAVMLNLGISIDCDLLSQMSVFDDYDEMRQSFSYLNENERIDQLNGQDCKELWKISRKYKKNVVGQDKKKSGDKDVSFEDFVPTGEIDEKLKLVYQEIPPVAESLYYGFNWNHVLEYSPDFIGDMTLSAFDDSKYLVLPVECQVIKPAERRQSKKGNTYYSMRVEDVNSQQASVNVWQEDYDRFKEEFTYWSDTYKGNLLRVRLERPSGGYPTFTFESPPKHLRSKVIPEKKELDPRVIQLKSAFDKVK